MCGNTIDPIHTGLYMYIYVTKYKTYDQNSNSLDKKLKINACRNLHNSKLIFKQKNRRYKSMFNQCKTQINEIMPIFVQESLCSTEYFVCSR